MKFWRIAVAIVLVLMVVAIAFGQVHAAPVQATCLFIVPPMYVARTLGEVFTVNIGVSNVQNLRAFEFKLGYNTTLLDALKVVQSSFFPLPPRSSVGKLQVNDTMGFVYVSISLSGSEPAVSGSGTLATVSFNATFAPGPGESAWCAFSLYDTALYDASMASISHDSLNGLYFWGSIQPDPPVGGRVLDLVTQKGGLGQGVPGGTFALGEMVRLTANVTYNGYMVQGQLASFEVTNPQNMVYLEQTAVTDDAGFATITFVIPYISDSLGIWTAISTTQSADKVVWDSLKFNVTYQVPPHGPGAYFTENTEAPLVNETVVFDASSSTAGWNGTNLVPITEYRWDFGDGNKTNVTTPIVTHAYNMPGTYYVTLTVYAPGASPETDTTLIAQKKTVLPPVVGGYTVSLSTSTVAKPLTPFAMLVAILAVAFGIIGLLFSLLDRLLKSTI